MDKASALEKPLPGFESKRVSDFSFDPLRPFFYAVLANRWKVKFRQGFAYFNNNVDSNRHIIIRASILYNEINSGQIMKNTIYTYVFIYQSNESGRSRSFFLLLRF